MKIKKNAPVLFERSVPDCTGRPGLMTRAVLKMHLISLHDKRLAAARARARTPKSFVRYSRKMGRRTDRTNEPTERGKKQYFDDEIRNDFRLRRRKSRNEPANEHEMERNTEQSGRAAGPLWDPN